MKKTFALVLALVCLLALSACQAKAQEGRESVSAFPAAAFSYAGDDGYKLITSEIDTLDTFDGLRIKPSDEPFEGEWIYRIVYNPAQYVQNAEEFVILFGEHSLSINGKTYVPEDGVSYADILEWAAGKYAYFDYELLPD